MTDNGDGTKTISCTDGTTAIIKDGDAGTNGTTGEPGKNGGNVEVGNFHGSDRQATEAMEEAGIFFPTMSITKATADTAGLVTVDFKVLDAASKPVLGLGTNTINGALVPGIGTGTVGVSAGIAKLIPGATGTTAEGFNKWVSYLYTTETTAGKDATVDAKNWPNADGTKREQPTSESAGKGATNGTLTDHGDGTYTYVFKTNISAVTTPVTNTAVTYERNRLHRVTVMIGGHFGPTGSTTLDFVPDGTTTTTEKRDILTTSTCTACHGEYFKAHGGNRRTVENCVVCHTAGSEDANSSESIDFKKMIHRIHAGADLPSVKWGGKKYRIWGYQNSMNDWSDVEFPAMIENCGKCHQGTGAQVDNWKNNMSREACGSCHDNINFVTGVINPATVLGKLKDGTNCTSDANCTGITEYGSKASCDLVATSTTFGTCVRASHAKQTSDSGCISCHDDSTAPGPVKAHDFTAKDPRNTSEYTASITLPNLPAKGYFDVTDPAPIVRIALTDRATNALIDHSATSTSQFIRVSAQQGCKVGLAGAPASVCPPKDYKFSKSNFYVASRTDHAPYLTTSARATILSATVGTWDLSSIITAKGTLELNIDGGGFLMTPGAVSTPGASTTPVLGRISVATAATMCATTTACTPAELVTWLNGNAAFKARAIAWVDPVTSKLGIRSRNLGAVHSTQVLASSIGVTVFGLAAGVDGSVVFTGSGANAVAHKDTTLGSPATLAADDPKVTYNAGYIEYQLDTVDDLAPGTYVASIEFGDRDRVGDTDYWTPTIAKVPFQVKTAAETKPIANNCSTCHSKDPKGDYMKGTFLGQAGDYARHAKTFDYTAMDQCGACHDYQPSALSGSLGAGDWPGGGGFPISRRVHGIHQSAELNYPYITVGYSGHGFDVEFPAMDPLSKAGTRNCEMCHEKGTTSGTWLTNANRLACGGCHDSDGARAHIRANTYDPTPAWPYSGDEQESCQTCH